MRKLLLMGCLTLIFAFGMTSESFSKEQQNQGGEKILLAHGHGGGWGHRGGRGWRNGGGGGDYSPYNGDGYYHH